ncbi:uncharacterized protein LOC143914510 isoform X3 [Arctopsyche grandis]|uniref:uncharacterized protein LOC143914510 isoform X3 n=1 Tax=Arctopsyche grandis TaxID=121162 RepID=UPI00406D9C63
MMCRPSPAAILAPAVSGVPTTLQSDEEHHLVLLDNSLLVPVLLATYYCQHNIGMMLQL